MFDTNEYTRFLLEEEHRLMRELGAQRMSWSKLGKMIKLSSLLRSISRMPRQYP